MKFVSRSSRYEKRVGSLLPCIGGERSPSLSFRKPPPLAKDSLFGQKSSTPPGDFETLREGTDEKDETFSKGQGPPLNPFAFSSRGSAPYWKRRSSTAPPPLGMGNNEDAFPFFCHREVFQEDRKRRSSEEPFSQKNSLHLPLEILIDFHFK